MFIALIPFVGLAQSRTMYIGEVELRLGMQQDAVIRYLTAKYKLTPLGIGSLVVSQHDEQKKYQGLGVVGFEDNTLIYISREIDTSSWPDDEGFSVARAIYDAINGSIVRTDGDGAKRADAKIVISSQDASRPLGNLRFIDIYVLEQKISVTIFDGPGGKSVSASVAIRSKPW